MAIVCAVHHVTRSKMDSLKEKTDLSAEILILQFTFHFVNIGSVKLFFFFVFFFREDGALMWFLSVGAQEKRKQSQFVDEQGSHFQYISLVSISSNTQLLVFFAMKNYLTSVQ